MLSGDLGEFQQMMYKKHKLKVFGYKPRGGKQQGDPDERVIAFLHDKGNKLAANHLAWTYYGAGDYKYAGLTTNKRLYDR
jgi:hypothetical protein